MSPGLALGDASWPSLRLFAMSCVASWMTLSFGSIETTIPRPPSSVFSSSSSSAMSSSSHFSLPSEKSFSSLRIFSTGADSASTFFCCFASSFFVSSAVE